MQIGVTITDRHRKILYVNPSEAEMHGYSVEELIGKDSTIFAPPDRWKHIELDEMTRQFRRESVNIRKDGSLFLSSL